MRRLLYILPLLAFVAVAAWFAVGLTRDPNRIPSALIDKPMPEFQLPALAEIGVPGLATSDIHGKVALVNVFASWCVPCRSEQPILMRLAREKGVILYGIDYKDQAPAGAAFLREFGNPYAAIGVDADGKVGIDWGVYGVPETFVIDREGRIRHKQIGPITPESLNTTILPLVAQLSK
ncbi:MAG TPA: DsbE family thiol:disulfide interchange protein [Alphaproteobacteria bacterium]|nr:DsbE family thiol:disulfide interchange protein [Alphaproteobacteria bacterium]